MTAIVPVRTTPVDLRERFGAGKFLVQVVGEHPVSLAEIAALPTATDQAHVLQPRDTWSVTIEETAMWAWSPVGGSVLAVSPA